MRVLFSVILASSLCAPYIKANEADVAKARLLEREGDSLGARQALQKAASEDADGLAAYADFLDRHRDPEARVAYEKILSKASGAAVKTLSRRLIQLDLIAGEREAALRHAERYLSLIHI